MNRVLSLAALCLLAAPPALALDPGACLVQSTSKLDALLNPAVGSDEDFFTAAGGAPNVMFILDNSGSMEDWPFDLCNGNNGCSCARLDGLGYVPAVSYEAEIKNLNSGNFWDEWFNQDKVYQVLRNYGADLNAAPSGTIWAGANRAAAITAACTGVGNVANCNTCLANKGYYLDTTSSKSRMVGNFLNHFSPRYLMLRRTLKQVIREIQPVRMALSTYWPNGSGGGGGGHHWTTENPVVLNDFNPPCNLSDPRSNGSSFDSNRQSIVNTVDNDLRFGNSTPLARTLWMAGFAFQDHSAPLYDSAFPTWQTVVNVSNTVRGYFEEKNGPNQKSICFGCTFNAIILLTDGEPNESTTTPLHNPQLTWPDCTGSQCGSTDLDEISKYLWTHDLRGDLNGAQHVATYTIGFGLDSASWALPLLAHTAEVGGGQSYTAYNATELKSALLSIFDNINTRATSFSTSSVASLQTGSSSMAALMPRIAPERNKPWSGELWRFDLFNEFVRGVDRNGDGDKDDVFIVDADGSDVAENSEGRFVKAGTDTAATPLWEARTKLRSDGHAGRAIYTVRDSDGNGAFTDTDARVAFTAANANLLIDYLGIRGAPSCPTSALPADKGTILGALGLDVATASTLLGFAVSAPPTAAELDELCARALIEWVRGMHLGDEDGNGNRTETRPSVLADIFHSSPAVVAAPVDKFICDLGLSAQCVRTLYATDLPVTATPVETGTVTNCAGRDVAEDAYEKYQRLQHKRQRMVLVGANDGMLHAFHDGDTGPETCIAGKTTYQYVNPTGHEAWAFIPPDLLPRLADRLTKHAYYVDADPMVRDIWVDSNNDGRKSFDEYHTIAIVPEGRGGTHYFTLEILWDAAGVAQPPSFRWLFPQPGTDEATTFGKTLYALSPKPPPIGPVLMDAASIGTTGYSRYGVDTAERWIAALSGGWSPGEERGRGFYVVDAWYGQVNGRTDNLWWKWEYSPTASGYQQESQRFLTHSVAAPVALVDYGESTRARIDGYFDTAVVGDLGGQLWVARLFAPGNLSGNLVSNWSAGRAFEEDRGAATLDRRWPFYFLPTIGIQPDNGALRAFIGSGNRYALLHPSAGRCQFDNPEVCAKYGCDRVEVHEDVKRLTSHFSKLDSKWDHGTPSAELERSNATLTACGVAGGEPTVTAKVDEHINCSGAGDTHARDLQVECKQRTAGDFQCARTDTTVPVLDAIPVTPSSGTISGLGKSRFYGVWAFGGRSDRIFDEAQVGPGALSALEFDGRRLTDRGGSGSGDLVDVSSTQCPSGGCTGPSASPDALGWVLQYDDLAHKTASGSTLASGCVLWNTLYPADGGTSGSSCEASGAAMTRYYQADFISGQPNCAASFKDGTGNFRRSIETQSSAPPPEPALIVQIDPQGILQLGTVALPPGSSTAGGMAQKTVVSETRDPLQVIYELPVSKALHNCRHTDAGCVLEAQ